MLTATRRVKAPSPLAGSLSVCSPSREPESFQIFAFPSLGIYELLSCSFICCGL